MGQVRRWKLRCCEPGNREALLGDGELDLFRGMFLRGAEEAPSDEGGIFCEDIFYVVRCL